MTDIVEIERLRRAVLYADKRTVSRVAYPHACMEERWLRDLIDAALGRGEDPVGGPYDLNRPVPRSLEKEAS